MKPVLQNLFRDPDGTDRGNCLQAAVASVLELPLEAVPHFVQEQDDGGPHWLEALNRWLEDRNMALARQGYFEVMANSMGLAVGRSPRDPARINHIVVSRCREIVHDPHPDQTGLDGTPEEWTWYAFVVLNPARQTQELGEGP